MLKGLTGAAAKARPLRPPTEAVISLMNKRIESVDWVDQPFEEVIGWLKDEDEGRANVLPRWGPLSAEGVDRDTLVTLQLSNGTVAEILSEVVDQLADEGQVTFHGFGNTLKISTRTDFDRVLYLRVYDVTDILFEVLDFGQEAPLIDLQRQNRGGGGGGGGGGGQSVFGGAGGGQGQSQGGQQAKQEREERLEELRLLVQETIAPETWDTGTGAEQSGRGRIRAYDQFLIVLNTIEVHEQITGAFWLGK